MSKTNQKLPEYTIVDGFRLPWGFDPQAFRDTVAYKPRDDDVFVVTYPKCGTTWMQYLTYLIYNNAEEMEDIVELNKHFPFLEMQGIDSVQTMVRPGILKTHVTWELTPKSPKAKYIYVARNPKDCCVSFYHHTEKHPTFNFEGGDFDIFFDLFMKGQVDYGDFFEHLLPWYEHRNEPNVLFILYEDMKHKPKESVYKVASFLGDKYKTQMDKDPSFVDKVLRLSSVDAMSKSVTPISMLMSKPGFDLTVLPSGLQHVAKKLKERAAETGRKVTDEFKLVRKGVTGGWKQTFTDEQNRKMDKRIEEQLGGTELFRIWKDGGYI